MAETGFELRDREKPLATIASDRGIFWRDHMVMAALGAAGVALVLWVIGNAHVLIGAVGAVAAIMVRGLYLASEQLSATWTLTNQRLVGPGDRSVNLLEIAAVRSLFGDVQIVTKAGDKHLLKHIAEPQKLRETILAAQERRRKQQR